MAEIKSFEDLNCWKAATELRRFVSKLTNQFPDSEKYRLVDQLKRASRSATNNIAEGYGRFHFKENIQFCRQARGSLYEVKDHMIITKDEHLIDNESFDKICQLIETSLTILNGYINYLKKQTENK